jgi:hypothetical protein
VREIARDELRRNRVPETRRDALRFTGFGGDGGGRDVDSVLAQ